MEFLTLGASVENGEYKQIIINRIGDYKNSTIGEETFEYAKEYYSKALKNVDVQKLKGLQLYIQLRGVDENGNKPNSTVSIRINPSKFNDVNWETITITELKKKGAICILDPTLPA